MKKIAASLALSLAAFSAAAETITIEGPVAGAAVNQASFYNVPNDAGIAALTILGCYGTRCTVDLDTTTCTATSGFVLACDNGQTAVANVVVTVVRKTGGSGRGGGYARFLYTLQSGTITVTP